MAKKKEENSLTLKQIRESFCQEFCELKNKECNFCVIKKDENFLRTQFREFLEVRK